MGRGEKVAWSLDASFKGVPFEISLRKFGFQYIVPKGTPEAVTSTWTISGQTEMIDPSLYKEVPGPKDAFEKWVEIEKAWTEQCEPGARIPRWFFRGQPSEHWTLQSTLERAI